MSLFYINKDENKNDANVNEKPNNLIEQFLIDINCNPDSLCKFTNSLEERLIPNKSQLDSKEIHLLLFVI